MKNAKKTKMAEIINLPIEPISAYKGLSVLTFSVGVETLQSQTKTEKKWLMFTDLMIADGVSSKRLQAEMKEEEKELHDQIKQMILRSFGDYGTARNRVGNKGNLIMNAVTGKPYKFTWEEIMTLSTKELSKADVEKRRTQGQMKIGARFALIRSHMERAEKAEAERIEGLTNGTGKKDSKTRVTRSKVDRVKKHISSALELLRNWGEDGADFNITQAVAELTKTYNSIK